MLAKSKLNSIISQSSISITSTDWHGNISHEEFNTIIKEKKNMRTWKKMWGM